MRHTTGPLRHLAALALAALSACASGPAGPTWEGRGDAMVALRVGEELGGRDAVLGVAFLGVSADSRCPANAMCFWQGDAAVEIGVRFGEGPTVPYFLHTGIEPRSVVVGAYRITLVGLRPYPIAPYPIPQGSYVAEFRVERLAR